MKEVKQSCVFLKWDGHLPCIGLEVHWEVTKAPWELSLGPMSSSHVEVHDQPTQGQFGRTHSSVEPLWDWLVHFFLQLADMWALGCILGVYNFLSWFAFQVGPLILMQSRCCRLIRRSLSPLDQWRGINTWILCCCHSSAELAWPCS
jgi:hypothetical protein